MRKNGIAETKRQNRFDPRALHAFIQIGSHIYYRYWDGFVIAFQTMIPAIVAWSRQSFGP
jgi:hypothetical protein